MNCHYCGKEAEIWLCPDEVYICDKCLKAKVDRITKFD